MNQREKLLPLHGVENGVIDYTYGVFTELIKEARPFAKIAARSDAVDPGGWLDCRIDGFDQPVNEEIDPVTKVTAVENGRARGDPAALQFSSKSPAFVGG
jgi:hypothetical protein